jgi:purine-binding chemotaxis protein CheW
MTRGDTDTAALTAVPNDAEAANAAREDLLQLVTFVVGDEEFGIPILSVHEINRMLEITRVPQSPPFVDGVINLRGKIIPVVNLRERFGLARTELGKDSRIIVVEIAGRIVGFTVDRVNEVLRIESGVVDDAPDMVAGIDSAYIEGVGKLEDRLLILLSLERLFGNEELNAIDKAAA